MHPMPYSLTLDVAAVLQDSGLPSMSTIGNYGIGGIAILATVYVARCWRESMKEAAEAAGKAAKEAADRLVAQNKECGDRNEKTVAVVDDICDRFGATTVSNTKMLTDTVTQLRADAARQQEQFVTLVREQREAHQKREEKLEQVLRDFRMQPNPQKT